MKNFERYKLLLVLVGVLLCLANLLAQTPTGFPISGLVLDADTGKPLPHANVFLANTMKGSVTDSTGRFIIRGVPVGAFEIVVSRIGYKVAKREILSINIEFQAFELKLSRILSRKG